MNTLPNSIRRGNPRKQGLIGVGDAIAWFCSHGYDVCLPLNDSQKYDLVVDLGGDLHRVKVKTSTRQAGPVRGRPADERRQPKSAYGRTF